MFEGDYLEGNKTLSQYQFKNGSTLLLIPREAIKINIQTLYSRGKVFPLFANPTDSVKDLKFMIHEREGIAPNQQILKFSDETLKDNHKLSDYGISEKSTLYLVWSRPSDIEIFLKDKPITLNPSDTIAVVRLKARREKIIKHPHSSGVLVFKGQSLRFDHTLHDYNIKEGSTINIQRDFIRFIRNTNLSGEGLSNSEIFVRILSTGDIVKLNIELDYTVGVVKLVIQEKEGIHPYQQQLMFNSKQLEDTQTLSYYNVRYGYTLQLKIIPVDIEIFVKIKIGKTTTIKVKAHNIDTIDDIIKAISREGISIVQVSAWSNKRVVDYKSYIATGCQCSEQWWWTGEAEASSHSRSW